MFLFTLYINSYMKNYLKLSNFIYPVNNILTFEHISVALNEFCAKELLNISNSAKIHIIFRVRTNKEWLIISPIQFLGVKDIDKLKDIFKLFWNYKSDIYKESHVLDICFRFVISDVHYAKDNIKYPSELEKKGLFWDYLSILPCGRLLETWGDELIINGDSTYIVNKNEYSYFVTMFEKEQHVLLKYQNQALLNYFDIYDCVDNNYNSFMRYIGDYVIYYTGNQYHIINKPKVSYYDNIKRTIFWI